MNWYYVEQGQQAGPVSDEQFDELVRAGKIQPDTLVWREGMTAWTPCRDAKTGTVAAGATAAVATASASEAACAECGKIFPIDETIFYGGARVCANCKPIFLQKLKEGAAISTGGLHYAGFWIRFAAKLLDGLILGIPFMIVFVAIGAFSINQSAPPQFSLLPFLIQVGFIFVRMSYDVFFNGKYGATPGKMICKLKIVTSEGQKISYGRAVGRFFGEMLSGIACYIGYIIAGFDNPQKRALHDHICNTRVIYR